MKLYKIALIIDDDEDLCLLLKTMLNARVPEVHCVYNIQNCKELLLRVTPDIVFIDNNLPDGKGVLFIKEIKARLPDARLIVISAMAGLQAEALEYGDDVFIEKPLTEHSLQKALGATN